MSGAHPDPDILERWRSYQWRHLFHATPADYDDAPGLTVDWDLQLAAVVQRVEDKQQPRLSD